MRVLVPALLLAMSLATCSDSLAPGEFNDEVQRARACSPGDPCTVFLSPKPCLCSGGVRASELARIEALAERVQCGEAQASCVDVPLAPTCVGGTCDGTEPPDGGAVDAGAD